MDQQNRTLLKIGLLANIFEWYEFSVFGYLAGFIGQLFFESSEPIVGLIRGFMLFTMSYLARPLGGLCFGLIGDRIGNGATLRLSLMLMSIPTILIGLLHTYSQMGVGAVFCLVLLRFTQGFAAGGELLNSGCYIFDNAPIKYKSLLCSAVNASAPTGMLMGSGVATLLVYYFDTETILNWAWRIPFLIGIPLTMVINRIRQNIYSPSRVASKPKLEASFQWRPTTLRFLQVISLGAFSSVGIYLLFLWMPSYLHHFYGIASNTSNVLNIIGLCIAIPLYSLGGLSAQRWGYHNVIKSSTISILFLIPLLFYGFQSSLPWSIFAYYIFAVVLQVPMQSTYVEMVFRLFPANYRNLGIVGLAFSTPAAFIGSTAPAVCTYVIHKTGWLMFPAFYICAFGLLALPAALSLKSPQRPSLTR